MPDLLQENALLQFRLTMAQAFARMLLKAYDALLTWGVNFRTLPTYAEMEDVAEKVNQSSMERGRERFHAWIERLESDIHAAVRRKQFRKV